MSQSYKNKKLKDDLADLTARLVSFRTDSGNTKEQDNCLVYIKKFLADVPSPQIKKIKYGDQPILIISNSPSKKPDIIMGGHIDVVPGTDKQYQPERKGNRLYGRGALDMKGGVAVLLKSWHDLLKEGTLGLPKIALHLTSDEETGAESSLYLAEKEKWRAKFMLVPEGAPKFQLVAREKGACWVKMNIEGKSAHAAYPWLGENAAVKLWQAYKDITRLFPLAKDDWVSTVSVSSFKSDDSCAMNQVPARAEAMLDIRYTNNFAKDANQVLEKLKQAAPEASFTLESHSDLLHVPDDNKYLARLLAVASEVKGEKVEPGFNHGASDAAIFASLGVPVVTSGIAGANHHADNEYVWLNTLVDYYFIVKKFIQEW